MKCGINVMKMVKGVVGVVMVSSMLGASAVAEPPLMEVCSPLISSVIEVAVSVEGMLHIRSSSQVREAAKIAKRKEMEGLFNCTSIPRTSSSIGGF